MRVLHELHVLGFQLTRLLRGATKAEPTYDIPDLFQLTRLLRGATFDDIQPLHVS